MVLDLKPKQNCFVEEYLVDLNATQAAIRAGYSPATAGSIGSRLLKTVNVRACIDKKLAEQSIRTGVNADRVIRELAKIAFINANDIIGIDATVKPDASRDDTAAIASVKIKVIDGDFPSTEHEIKLHDKNKALELLGKHLGMFTDNVHLSGDVGVQIINDIPKSPSKPD